MENERQHLVSVRGYRSDLKGKIEATKHTLNLQLDAVFDSLNEKSLEVEGKILSNLEKSEEDLELCMKSLSLTYDLSISVDKIIDDLVRQIQT